MKRKMICYFETEAQCEAAVTALKSAGIRTDDVRIVTDSTKRSEQTTPENKTIIGPSAPFALPNGYIYSESNPQTILAQAPVATLLIRGDLFTFHDRAETPLGSCAVEVCGNKEDLELARDILLNLF